MPRVHKTAWIDKMAGTRPCKAPARQNIRWIASRLARTQHPDIASDSFYSLAQHSLIVSRVVKQSARVSLYGLMHFAPAAWLGAISREAQDEIERLSHGGDEMPVAFLTGICERLAFAEAGLPAQPPVEVLRLVEVAVDIADRTALRDVVPNSEVDPSSMFHNEPITPWTWTVAEEKFLEQYDRLFEFSKSEAVAA